MLKQEFICVELSGMNGGYMVLKSMPVLKALICVILAVQLSGCGTIMYPGRRGQQAGKIDAGVAVMDGVGLLIFLIPGIIAFAVDFSTGAIYLPGTTRSSLDPKNVKVVKFDPAHSTSANVEAIVKRETGLDVKLSQPNVKVTRLDPNENVKENIIKANQE